MTVTVETLNQCLEVVMDWMRAKKLKIHSDRDGDRELLLSSANEAARCKGTPLKTHIHT